MQIFSPRQLRVALGALALGGLCLWPAAGLAHVIQSNDGIEASLHVDPDDNPVAGRPSPINFIMSREGQRFDLSDCTCHLTIRQGDRRLYDGPIELIANSATLKQTFTFPRRNVYQLELTGRPSAGDAFPPFRFRYVVRVETTAGLAQPGPVRLFVYGLLGLGALGTVWWAGRDIIAGRRTPQPKP